MELQELIENRWTNSAEKYSNIIQDELNCFKKYAWTSLILENAPKKEKLEILDVGTGPGFFAIILSLAGHNVTAVDCSKDMIAYAKKNAHNAGVQPDFRIMDSHNLSFEDESFDLIVSRNVMWTLRDPEATYKEWKRVLRPDGRILIFDANWNLRFFDEEYMQKFQKDQCEYVKMYGKIFKRMEVNVADKDNMDDFIRWMPMNRYLRPQYDFNILIKTGFTKIYFDIDIIDKLWDETEKLMYRSTPMFMISVSK